MKEDYYVYAKRNKACFVIFLNVHDILLEWNSLEMLEETKHLHFEMKDMDEARYVLGDTTLGITQRNS